MGLVESVVLFLILFLSSVYYFWVHRFSHFKRRGVAHEEPSLIYGNSKGINKEYHLTELLSKHYHKFKNVSKFCGIFLFIRPVSLIIDLDLIKNILIKDFNYFTNRGIYHNVRDDPLSGHLFLLDGAMWKYLRTKLTPTFTSGKMKFMFPTIVEVGHHFEEIMDKSIAQDSIVEIRELSARFTTDVIGTCAFGINCNSLNDPNAEFRTQGRKIFSQNNNPIKRVILNGFPKIARFFRMRLTPPATSDFFIRVVRETVKEREENSIHRNDFMDLLIALKGKKNDSDSKGLTIEQIAAQCFVFFLAGFETSSATMSYCLYELALNPSIQDKLRHEIDAVLQKHDGKFTYEAMIEMKYMDQVIDETLRKYPPVPVLFREAVKHYNVPDTDLYFEENDKIIIPVHVIHFDPELYPNPDIFDPERFSPEEVRKRHPCAYLPFGDGPRNCIGLRFGKMQTRVGLVSLLRNFKFTTCERTEIPLKLDPQKPILAPKSGIELKVEKL